MSYGEIKELIDVPKSTLATWCRDIVLAPAQSSAIVQRTGGRVGVPRDTQRRRRLATAEIRRRAQQEAHRLIESPAWTAGTAMYWAEGSKSSPRLSLANSDPRISALFIGWVRRYHSPDAEFVLKLNLHADNDERAAREVWRTHLRLPDARFYKTYVKPDGTGHRRNHLAWGVCEVRVRRSADAWHRTMGWIDGLADRLGETHC